MMRNDHGSFDENDWTAEEKSRLATLRGERVPPPALKQRTIRALRNRALLGRSPTISPPLVVAMLLAASVVFAAGALIGYRLANRQPAAVHDQEIASTRSVAQLDSVDSAARRTRHVVWY
jgi:hypothetical protein